MNIFKIIAEGIGLVKNLKKQDTPESGEKIKKAGKKIIQTGLGVNAASLVGFSSFTFEEYLNYYQSAPVPTVVLTIALVVVNVAPHIAGLLYNEIGKSQIK